MSLILSCMALPASSARAFTYDQLGFHQMPNGHYYGVVIVNSTTVGETFTFAMSKSYAHSLRINNMPGHLATIIGNDEQQIIKDHAYWFSGQIAAHAEPNGPFTWVDGPEAGDPVTVPTNVGRLQCCSPGYIEREMWIDADRWYDLDPNQYYVGPYSDSWHAVNDPGGSGGHQPGLLIEFTDTWTVPQPRMDYPPGGTLIHQGDTIPIGWSTQGGCGPIVCGTLSVSTNGVGGPFQVIADSLAGTGEYEWFVDGAASDSVYFKISVCDSTGFTGEATGTEPVTILGVSDHLRPLALDLADPVPNPVSGVASLGYRLPRDGRVTLSIVDIQGRLLRVLVSERQSAGPHHRLFDSHNLGTGVVFARLHFEGRDVLRRVVLLK